MIDRTMYAFVWLSVFGAGLYGLGCCIAEERSKRARRRAR